VTCDAFSDVVLEVVRGTLPPASRAEALSHADGCAECRERLSSERRLSQELRDWAAADAHYEAPLALEARLRRAVRAERRRATGSRRAVPSWTWPVAAAVAGLALWGAIPRQTARTQMAGVEEAAFQALPGGDLEDMDGYQVVRVELSRPALARLGFAVGDLEARAVAADVIVGQDGVARGIRLVR
jgi:anti-sigma factor RsiW